MSLLKKLRFTGIALLTCFTVAAVAQPDGGGTFEPRMGQAGKDVIWIPTPDAMVDRMLRMAEVSKDDFVVDLGSGDGKIAIAAARNLGARALGLEYNPDMVELSKRRAREAGVQDKVEFRHADIFASDFSNATVVTMYLLPSLNLKLRPTLMKMKPGTRLTSHSFDMGAWVPDETSRVNSARGYLWIVPANVQGTWRISSRDAGVTLPQQITIQQRFQRIGGEATIDNLGASLQNARVRGADISFTTRDAQGRQYHFNGRANGNTITGTVTSAGQGPINFEAQRSGTPAPIDVPGPLPDERYESLSLTNAAQPG